MSLDLAGLVSAAKPKIEKVVLDELGEDIVVYVREIPVGLRDEIRSAIFNAMGDKKPLQATARYLLASLCDENGEPLGKGDLGMEQIKALPTRIAEKIYKVSSDLNAFDEKPAEELRKNSEVVPSDSSASS